MAARLHPFTLAALGLSVSLLPALGHAQGSSIAGGGSVTINLQAIDQAGGYAAPGYGGPVFNTPAGYGVAPVYGRPPLPGEGNPPRPLLGDSGARNSAARLNEALRLKPPRGAKAEATASAAPAGPAPMFSRPPAAASAGPSPTPVTPAPAPSPAIVLAPPPAPAPSIAAAPAPPAAAPRAVTPAPLAAPAPVVPPAAPSAAPQAAPVVAPPPAAPVVAPPAAASNPANQQTALLAPPPVAAPAGAGGMVTLAFDPGKSELPAQKASLEALAKRLAGSEERIQIRAYASATGTDAASGARRLSLSRALQVRAYLIDQGIRSTRIDVRALGTPTDGGPADRVEVAPAGR